MPSKLQKAIAAVKDQTSISLAKVKTSTSTRRSSSSLSALELGILRATTHDEVPITDHQVHLILGLVSSSRSHASTCARALGRRITRTRSWAVALKSLLLVLRLFQHGDPHFPKEVLSAMKRGRRILNLSSYSSSASWHFTAFIRTFALYLDERLHCFLTGRLVPLDDTRPPVLVDRVSHWQRLLDRAVGTRPTGPAASNRLVHASIHAVAQETFQLYRDVSSGLAFLLDSFFHLEPTASTRTYEACVKASAQFAELAAFYDFCKAAGVGGRASDYPSVTGMSEDLLYTLRDFLQDQQPSYRLPNPPSPVVLVHGRARATSLEDLISDVPSSESDFPPSSATHSAFDDDSLEQDCNVIADDDVDGDGDYVDYDGRSRSGWELALLEDATFRSMTTHPMKNGEIDQVNDHSSLPFFDPYNPFLEDRNVSYTPPSTKESHGGFACRYVQPTFRVDLQDDENSGLVDLFAELGEPTHADAHANTNCQLTFPNALDNDGFHANSKIRNADTILNPTEDSIGMLSPIDEFTNLSIGSTQT